MHRILSYINAGFFFLLIVLPLGGGLIYSFLYSIGGLGLLNEEISGKALLTIWEEGTFLKSLFYSVYIALLSIGISVALSLTLTLGIKLPSRENPYWMYMPLALPGMVVAFLMFQWLSRTGVFSRVMFQAGIISEITDFPVLIQDELGLGIIIAHVLMATPFFWIFFRGLYQTERVKELGGISASLGAQKHQILWKVKIPVLLQQGLPTIILYFLFVLGSYEIPLLLGQSSPQMLSVTIIRKLERFNLLDKPEGYAMIWMYALIVLVAVYAILSLHQKRKAS
ncbi:MAG: ABC transporter permease subunit [Bacteroidota bacterium]